VLTAIDEALVATGHRSIVIGCRGSRSAGECIEIPVPSRAHILDPDTVAGVHRSVRAVIAETLQSRSIDLVHLHGIDFPAYLPDPGPPVLVTLHLPPGWYPREALAPSRPRTWLNCVSQSQHAVCPHSAALLPAIPNGVGVEMLACARHARRSFALMLARVCPEKGQHLALEAVHAAAVPLLIGGEVFPYPAHADYFATKVRPLLDRFRRFLGPIGLSRKRRLLAAARCVLIPSLAPETSSLVAMEAAAAGTPVIAFPNGALAETVLHGESGFLVNGVGEMAEAMARVDEIDPEACRRIARTRFSRQRMTERYVALYHQLARTSTAR
jgi:glycosyltransferase involved in cell wall biosynthesis